MSAIAGASVVGVGKSPVQSPPPQRQLMDADSRRWLDQLRGGARERDDAVARLHALLLKAARFEVSRRQGSLPHLRGNELGDIAQEAADDALVAVLAKLDQFRGASRFTTWAYKFALLEAAVKLRRRAWQGREMPITPEGWSVVEALQLSPGERAEQGELISAVGLAIEQALTPHQRRVLIALALDGVPIDVLAERLRTTRGALYKTLHDARVRLRARLEASGLVLSEFLEGGGGR